MDPVYFGSQPVVSSIPELDARPHRDGNATTETEVPLTRRERVAVASAVRFASQHGKRLPPRVGYYVCRSREGWIVDIYDADRPWVTSMTRVRLSHAFKLRGFGASTDACDFYAKDIP